MTNNTEQQETKANTQATSFYNVPVEQPRTPKFELARVFTLLGLIGAIVAIGFASTIFIMMDDRLENIEKSYPISMKSMESKISDLDTAINEPDRSGAKQMMVGSEISKTLYLMRQIAVDNDFDEQIRARAAKIVAESEELLKELNQ